MSIGVMIGALGFATLDCGSDSRLFHIRVTTLDKLFTHVPLSTSSYLVPVT